MCIFVAKMRSLQSLRACLAVMAWGLFLPPAPASAETASIAPAAPAKSAEERAQAQADRVFTWIKFQNEAPVKKPAAAAASPTPPAAKPVSKAVTAANAPPKPASLTAKSAERDTRDQETMALGHAPVAASAAALRVAAVDAIPTPTATPAPESTSAPAQALAAVATATAAAPEVEAPQLRLIHRVEPEFPARMARDFSGGSVVLRFVVQADGSVQQAESVRATHAKLATAAITAVSQWRFAPIPRPREGRVEIGFRPEE
ncbi:TonB family protein [Roseateles koreensis]|uniref:TonB family protein n=1 Tax=Roseateles koreensis TaxID=2987526 RepID=A0ABT5KR45_9BURK|nr:TonB family protein [Roseateles koreensis]MDC8785322.1 TonB family protein [Roseateles koreensis]